MAVVLNQPRVFGAAPLEFLPFTLMREEYVMPRRCINLALNQGHTYGCVDQKTVRCLPGLASATSAGPPSLEVLVRPHGSDMTADRAFGRCCNSFNH